MTVEFWLLGVLVFWVVARFTIMKYDDLNFMELCFLVAISLLPNFNLYAAAVMIVATIIHKIHLMKGVWSGKMGNSNGFVLLVIRLTVFNKGVYYGVHFGILVFWVFSLLAYVLYL